MILAVPAVRGLFALGVPDGGLLTVAALAGLAPVLALDLAKR